MKDLKAAIQHCKEKAAELREYSDVLSETSTTPKGKEISDCLECAEEHEQLAEWLKELKQRREADRWIPVSERLPEEYDSYLVMWRSLTEGFPDRLFYEICEYEPDEYEWERIEQAGEAGAEIVAWMPLPERYEPKENKK